jgi:Uma2 family endonuclease
MKTSLANKALAAPRSNRHVAQPAWEVALLFPEQGSWDEDDYFALPDNQLVELSEGRIEVLPKPTTTHQWIVLYLSRLLDGFASEKRLGIVVPAPLRVRLWPGKIREPDVVFLSNQNRRRDRERFWEGADLVMEVVSGDRKARQRDRVIKRAEYAKAGIPEYWIVDPIRKQITVLFLHGDKYAIHGTFKAGRQAKSRLLPGFAVDVTATFAGP